MRMTLMAVPLRGSYPSRAIRGSLQQLENSAKIRSFVDHKISYYWANKDMELMKLREISREITSLSS